MLKDWNFWLSVITLIGVLSGFGATWWQIKVSNKQKLFDRRLEKYIIIKELIELYTSKLLDNKLDKASWSYYDIDFIFSALTNGFYLKDIQKAILYVSKDPEYIRFRYKYIDVLKDAEEIKFIFEYNEAKLLSDFVLYYGELLMAIYQYKIDIEHMKQPDYKKIMQEHKEELTEEEIMTEEKAKGKLQLALDNVRIAYEKIKMENVMQKIEKQISLVKIKT